MLGLSDICDQHLRISESPSSAVHVNSPLGTPLQCAVAGLWLFGETWARTWPRTIWSSGIVPWPDWAGSAKRRVHCADQTVECLLLAGAQCTSWWPGEDRERSLIAVEMPGVMMPETTTFWTLAWRLCCAGCFGGGRSTCGSRPASGTSSRSYPPCRAPTPSRLAQPSSVHAVLLWATCDCRDASCSLNGTAIRMKTVTRAEGWSGCLGWCEQVMTVL